jgi:hypothetical protein
MSSKISRTISVRLAPECHESLPAGSLTRNPSRFFVALAWGGGFLSGPQFAFAGTKEAEGQQTASCDTDWKSRFHGADRTGVADTSVGWARGHRWREQRRGGTLRVRGPQAGSVLGVDREGDVGAVGKDGAGVTGETDRPDSDLTQTSDETQNCAKKLRTAALPKLGCW